MERSPIQWHSEDIPRCICKLLRNKVYIVTCFCICCEMFIIIGFAGFLPKYLETEYQTSKSQASMIAAVHGEGHVACSTDFPESTSCIREKSLFQIYSQPMED
ncbi:unnamed protein product [Schistocephalus solidus]|uniref:Transmembrane protein n=1 Tax=Schistocephalus solidus TaxID=70667 RepID=A0A183TQZ0_SCHSO|nr:unnamed protein product [Schistocephalus solidus]